METKNKPLFRLCSLLVVLVFLTITGCQSATPEAVEPTQPPAEAPVAATQAEPVAEKSTEAPTDVGGQVVYCRGFAGPGINPLVANDIEVWALFDALVQLDMKLQARPALAEKWEMSADGKTYTFFMNKNAEWSDGKPVTAQDVVFTFDKVADTSINPINRGAFGPMESLVGCR